MERRGYLVVKIIQCTLNGWPDLMCLKNGKVVFIEVKRPGGRASPLQLLRHEQLRAEGFPVLLIDNLNKLNDYAL